MHFFNVLEKNAAAAAPLPATAAAPRWTSLPRLNKFTFTINTDVFNQNIGIDLPFNEDIQRSFLIKDLSNIKIYSIT
jgi:hypothetical protein